MKKGMVILAGLALLPALLPAQTHVDFGVSISDGRLADFYLAVGSHYGVAPREVVAVRDRYHFPDEDLPVVYFLAARAHVAPSVIIGLRAGRTPWFDIALRFGLSPDIFFVPVAAERIGPPYGHAYGYYQKHRGGKWKGVVLADREVVDLVNLRFMSEYHRIPPADVIAMRGRGTAFVSIHEHYGKGRGKTSGHDKIAPAPKEDKGKGKGDNGTGRSRIKGAA